SMSSSSMCCVRWLAQTRAAADSIPNVARGLTVQRCVAAANRDRRACRDRSVAFASIEVCQLGGLRGSRPDPISRLRGGGGRPHLRAAYDVRRKTCRTVAAYQRAPPWVIGTRAWFRSSAIVRNESPRER